MPKRILFRVDSATHIGNGHFMRCLALADAATNADVFCTFLCRKFPGSMHMLAEDKGYQVLLLPQPSIILHPTLPCSDWLGVSQKEDAQQTREQLKKLPAFDWLIVDSYAIDAEWHDELQKDVEHLMVIDDLANREYHCDLLLDQTAKRRKTSYRDRVDPTTELLLGGKYSLLRSEFVASRHIAQKKREDTGIIQRLLISLGGVDPFNLTQKLVEAVAPVVEKHELNVTVVLAGNAPHAQRVRQALKELVPAGKLVVGSKRMDVVILENDVAIGAGGVSSWERCCLGIPTLLITAADNQRAMAKAMEKAGAVIAVGSMDEIDTKKIKRSLEKLIKSCKQYQQMVENAFSLCDGKGAQKVIKTLLKITAQSEADKG